MADSGSPLATVPAPAAPDAPGAPAGAPAAGAPAIDVQRLAEKVYRLMAAEARLSRSRAVPRGRRSP